MESDNKNIQEQLQIVTDWCMASLIDQQASSSSILPAALAALWGTKPGIIYYVLVVANLAETSVSIPSVTRITLLKIDVVNNTYYQVYNVHSTFYNYYWSEAVLGNDGCIYWPPLDDYHTLKFDTETQTISRIGDHLGELEH